MKYMATVVSISNYGNGYKIKAYRYSNRKCYTDTGYYMVAAPNEVGELQLLRNTLKHNHNVAGKNQKNFPDAVEIAVA